MWENNPISMDLGIEIIARILAIQVFWQSVTIETIKFEIHWVDPSTCPQLGGINSLCLVCYNLV
jgi:hypothetical protein